MGSGNREKGTSGGGRGEDEGENGKLEEWANKRDWMRRGEYEEIEKQNKNIYVGVEVRETEEGAEDEKGKKQTNTTGSMTVS